MSAHGTGSLTDRRAPQPTSASPWNSGLHNRGEPAGVTTPRPARTALGLPDGDGLAGASQDDGTAQPPPGPSANLFVDAIAPTDYLRCPSQRQDRARRDTRP